MWMEAAQTVALEAGLRTNEHVARRSCSTRCRSRYHRLYHRDNPSSPRRARGESPLVGFTGCRARAETTRSSRSASVRGFRRTVELDGRAPAPTRDSGRLHIVSYYGHCGPTVTVTPCLVQNNVRGTATPGAGAQSAQRAQQRSCHPWSRMRYGQVCSQTTMRKSGACASDSRCWSQNRQRRPEARAPRRLHTHFLSGRLGA